MGGMSHPFVPTSVTRPTYRLRRAIFVAAGSVLAVLIAVLVAALATGGFAAAVAPLTASTQPFAPTAEAGLIAEGDVVTLADKDVPAIARLDPALLDAMRQAQADAAGEGLEFHVTSGWRSAEYQQWLLDEAIDHYASEEVARQFVAPVDRSSHVTGKAVDIVPIDAQFWLIEHGSRYGICQTYANERWHFERATEPGGICPGMKLDAAS
jgi:membrane-associated protease RseP (regulator of RpoE activity)